MNLMKSSRLFGFLLPFFLLASAFAQESGEGEWRVLFASGLTQQEAERNAEDYEPMELDMEVAPRNGQYAIYIGRYETREAAEEAFEEFENVYGLLPEQVVQVGDAGSAGTSPQVPTPPGAQADEQMYRVQVGSFSNREDAEELKTRVETEMGIFLVDIVPKGDRFFVMAGFAMPDQQEAQEFTQELQSLGLSNAEVVEVSPETLEPTQEDLEEAANNFASVTESEREEVYQIMQELSRARTEGGGLTEQAALMGEIEGLNPDQRRLLDEVERQLAEERALRQQAHEYDQQVQQAFTEENYDRAIEILEEWRELEPDSQHVIRSLEEARRRKALEGGEGTSLVADNDFGEPVFTTSGNWTQSNQPGYEDGMAVVADAGSDSTAIWTVTLDQGGFYEVSVYYPASSELASSAFFEIRSGDEFYTATIDQKQSGGQWVSLGSHRMASGPASVTLNAGRSSDGDTVIADAVRFAQTDEAGAPAQSPRQGRQSRLLAEAGEAEQAGRLEEAKRLYQEVRSLDPDQETLAQVNQALSRIEDRVASGEGGGAPSQGGSNNLLLYILIGIGILILAGVVVLILKKKKEPAPARQTAAPTATASSLGGLQGAAGGQQKTSPMGTKKTQSATAKSSGQKQQQGEKKPADATTAQQQAKGKKGEKEPAASSNQDVGSDGDRIRPGVRVPAPGGEETSQEATSEESGDDSIHLDSEPEPAAEQPPASEEQPAQSSGEATETDETIRLAEESPPEEKKAEPQEQATEPAEAEPKEKAPQPEAQQKPAAPAPAPAAAKQHDDNIFYQQNFEDEEIGQPPKNWKGSYDYASLTVADTDGLNGSSRCMRFEKRQGSGSAYYSCKFPDATGRVTVEFDLRCDDKNKYLLGFYIEKDGDFRHSIHTVVHRDMTKESKVSLRLQNESVPYTLGEWVHVKFMIDLPRNLVDGHVNDKAVALGVRLASRPRMVNTLSIRDNLATEGVLNIDNIKIYRDR